MGSSGATVQPAGLRWVLLPVVGALGLALERSQGGWADPAGWVPDLLVGVVLVAAALVMWPRSPALLTLLGLAGLCWFGGTLWSAVAFLHIGPLVHALLSAPQWLPRSRIGLTAVVGGWAVAWGMPAWGSDAVSIGLAIGLFVALFAVSHGAAERDRSLRRGALGGGAVLALEMLVGAALRVLGAAPSAELSLHLHELAVVAVAVGLVLAVRQPATELVTDLVVELGEADAGSLRDGLVHALGDRDLELGYWVGSGAYADADGRRVVLPVGGKRRRSTFVERDGRPFAVLVHDAVVLEHPALVEAVASAARLTDTNAALRAQVGARLVELDASRRRLLVAADLERTRLAQRLHDGVELRLGRLHAELSDAAGPVPDAPVRQVLHELAQCRADLSTLASGLRPRELDRGLADAVRGLAARSPLSLVVAVTDERFDVDVETTAWFICAEGVVNAVKHSAASHVTVAIARRGTVLEIVVADDGVGGADAARGPGLRGLIDRVEAHHGRARVSTSGSGGTRVTAQLPLDAPSP